MKTVIDLLNNEQKHVDCSLALAYVSKYQRQLLDNPNLENALRLQVFYRFLFIFLSQGRWDYKKTANFSNSYRYNFDLIYPHLSKHPEYRELLIFESNNDWLKDSIVDIIKSNGWMKNLIVDKTPHTKARKNNPGIFGSYQGARDWLQFTPEDLPTLQ